MLDEWNENLKQVLGVDLDIDTEALLTLAADAAHNVVRPAAPLTTFLVGYVAGLRGGSPTEVADAIEKARTAALQWTTE